MGCLGLGMVSAGFALRLGWCEDSLFEMDAGLACLLATRWCLGRDTLLFKPLSASNSTCRPWSECESLRMFM